MDAVVVAPRRPTGIVTPEAVILEFEPAGIASRALAKIIDVMVLWIGFTFFLSLVGGLVSTASGGVATGAVILLALAGFISVFGYWIASETLMRGRTIGKAALGLRVVTAEGGPIHFRHAFIRAVVGVVDFIIPPGGSVAMASCLLTPRVQRLGDLAAGTIVLRDRSGAGPSMAVAFTLPGGEWHQFATRLDTSRVTEPEYGLLRRFAIRANSLNPEARTHLAGRLDAYFQQRLGVARPPSLHPEWFLQCVGSAYQLRAGLIPPPPIQRDGRPPPPPLMGDRRPPPPLLPTTPLMRDRRERPPPPPPRPRL